MSLSEHLRIADALAFPDRPGVLQTIAEVLTDLGVEHLVVGGFAVGALSARPRATEDVDLLVWQRDLGTLCDGLAARFGPLEVDRFRSLARVKAPAMDIVAADAVPLRRQAMAPENTQPVRFGAGVLRLPTAPSEIVLKLGAILSITRSPDDAAQDIVDVRRILTNHPELQVGEVVALGRALRTRSPKEVALIIETLKAGGTFAVSHQGSRVEVICIPR